MSTSQNKMGVVQLTILTMVNMMGSGIIMLPTKLAQVGTISILSWLVTAGGSLALAYAFAKCGRFSKNAGGMGGYAEYAFGKSGNFIANYTYAVSLVIANIAIAITAVGYLAQLMEWKDMTPQTVTMWTIIFVWVTTVANFGGASITGKIGGFTVWGVVIPVLGISIIGWYWFSPSMYADAWNPHNYTVLQALPKSISITLWSFLGLESACANSDAVENPEKNVPIAVFGGTLLTAIVYIVSTNVVAGIVPNADLAASDGPFGLVFASIFTPTVGKIVMGLMVLACTGSLLGWQFTVAQVFKSSADQGYFPKVFSKVTKTNTPLVGMIILCIVQTLLSLMTMSPSLSEQFDVLVNLAVVTNLVPYVLSMSALYVMQKVSNVPAGELKVTTIVALIGNIYSFYALYGSGADAMLGGGLVTFFGWVIYGQVAGKKFDLKEPY